MTPRRPFPRWFAYALLLLGPLAVAAAPAPAPAGKPTREQQIADLERQIAELTKRLQELKAQPPVPKDGDGPLDPEWVKTLNWRSIGPASMGGRIVDFAVCENDPATYWVATASGGLLKTTNNGTTFEHQFDHEATVSLGAVAVAPSDPNVVWVGTGENNPRNSVSYGDGVYKSTDGGKTWKNMGLQKSFQIGHIVIHPTNPNVVYVGALGRLYGPGGDRGLFKTSDGGQSWERVLPTDDRTGVIDVKMNPANPEELLVATWERQRDGYDSVPGDEQPPAEGYDRYDPIKKWGPGSGLYRTTDGGKTFRKVTAGLPTVPLGRIGLDYYRKDPHTVFAIIDSQEIGMGRPPSTAWLGVAEENVPAGVKIAHVVPNGPAARAGLKEGDVLKAIDKKELKNRRDLIDLLYAHQSGDKLDLTVERGKETKEVPVTLERRPENEGGPAAGAFAGLAGEDSDGGVRVRRVEPDSPAAKAGLRLDDLVTAIDKKDVRKFAQLAEVVRAHKPGDQLTLAVQRGKEAREVVLTLGGPPRPKRPYSFWYGGQRENVQDDQGPDGVQCGGLYRSTDGGESWTRLNSVNPRPMYFSQVRVDPSDDRYVYVLGILLYRSHDGGVTFKPDGGNEVHPDQHALWIDPHDGRHMLVGCDGGFYATYDRMDHWDFLNTVAIGQFYGVATDARHPYRAFGGLQDNGTWGITSHSLSGPGPTNDDAVVVGGGDGFQVRVDPTDPDLVYFESQDGHMARRNLRTGAITPIRPREPRGRPAYRFNWNTPFLLSSHNAHIFYCGGNYVFRSVSQGNDLREISPEITRTKRGSATALAESPRNPEVLWAGTDDGCLWVKRDAGAQWENVTARVGLPGPRWVASIEASRAAEGRAYVVFDGHRSDDDEPYVFVTEDFGQTWKPLRGNLPWGSTRVLREDAENPDLLYLGTEFAVYASLDRGASWTKINNNLPTVAVLEFAQPAGAGEVVAATHGRSLWVLDVTALRQMTPEVRKAKAHLFRPATAMRWRSEPQRGSPYGAGSRHFVGQNPPRGAQITYSLTQKAEKVGLKVVDYTGRVVKEWPAKELKTEPGLHRVGWDLLGPAAARRGLRRGEAPQPVPAGMYRVVLTADGQEQSEGLRVEVDPLAAPPITADEDDEEEMEREMEGYRIRH